MGDFTVPFVLVGAIYRSKNLLPLKFRKMFANALMLPQFDYLDIIWSKTFKYRLKELDILYKKVAKIALDVKLRESSIEICKNMDWLPLHLKRQLHLSAYMYRIINENYPQHFIEKSLVELEMEIIVIYTHESQNPSRIFYLGAKAWNILPKSLRASESVQIFSSVYKKARMESVKINRYYQINNSFNDRVGIKMGTWFVPAQP
jgi:hypothetical protein